MKINLIALMCCNCFIRLSIQSSIVKDRINNSESEGEIETITKFMKDNEQFYKNLKELDSGDLNDFKSVLCVKGGFGKVYIFEGKYVYKEIDPCRQKDCSGFQMIEEEISILEQIKNIKSFIHQNFRNS